MMLLLATAQEGWMVTAGSKSVATPRSSVKMMPAPGQWEQMRSGGQAIPNAQAWYIFPRDPGGMITTDYMVGFGQEQVLGRFDMSPTGQLRPDQAGISPQQCAVQIAPDGSHAVLYALGQTPTGFRSGPHEPWQWLQPGQQQMMQHHWKISMDYNYPDQAVFKLADGYILNQEMGGGGGQQVLRAPLRR